MASPNPQNLQVLPTQQPAQQEPAPQQVQRPQIPMEDRQLTPEETESLLRGVTPEPAQPIDNGDDAEQAQMAQDFFRELPAPTQQPVQQAPQPRPGDPPAVPTPGVLQQAVQQTQQAAQQPVAQPAPQYDPQIASLQAQNQLLQAQIQQMMTQMQAPQQPTQQPVAQQQPSQIPQMNVPDDYLNALASEDVGTRRAALNGLLNGAVQVAMQSMRQEVDARVQQLPQQIDTRVQNLTKAQQIQQDMFGTYPELVAHKQFVRVVADQMAGNLGLDAWNDNLRDAIAERLAPMVPGLYQKVQGLRASRVGQAQAQQYGNPQYAAPQHQPQFLPQGQGNGYGPTQPNPQMPAGGFQQPVGGVHGGPVYVRDAAGNLVPYQPQQQFVAGQQTRPGGQQVDPRLQDIWSTLGF